MIDGRDIAPLLLGKSKESPREAHYYFKGTTLEAVRQGPWKLALAPQVETMGRGVEADATKTPRHYDLGTDIGERTDVASQHPDVIAKLQTLAARMNAEIAGKSPPARRPAGTVANPVTLYPTEPNAPKKAKETQKPKKK